MSAPRYRTYHLWRDRDGSLSFLAAGDVAQRRRMQSPAARFVRRFFARDWTHAMDRYHAFMGWGPYRPADERES